MQCFSCKNKVLFIFNTKDYVSGKSFKIYRCKICHIDFPDPRPFFVNKYYPKQYRKYPYFIKIFFNFFYSNLAKKIDSYFDHKKKILIEIGCGDGLMLNKFKDLGWEVFGTERNIEIRKNNLFNISTRSLNSFNDNSFDLIFLNNSFEHIHNFNRLLLNFKKKLKKNGYLILNIPSTNSFQYKVGTGFWFHLDVPRHLQIFDDKFFLNFSKEYNFKISINRSIGIFWEFYGWFQTLNNKFFNNRNLFFQSLISFRKFKKYFFLGIVQFLIFFIPSFFLTIYSFLSNKGSIKNFVLIKN
jgi:SAM-dependent methyltransferase